MLKEHYLGIFSSSPKERTNFGSRARLVDNSNETAFPDDFNIHHLADQVGPLQVLVATLQSLQQCHAVRTFNSTRPPLTKTAALSTSMTLRWPHQPWSSNTWKERETAKGAVSLSKTRGARPRACEVPFRRTTSPPRLAP